MKVVPLPDRRMVRQAFSRAAATYAAHAVLQREVTARLAERLDFIRLQPNRVLDIGSGTGFALPHLARRFAAAQCVALDLALPMLLVAREAARATQPWHRRLLPFAPPPAICADAEHLPLAPACVDLAFSCLTLQWCDTRAVFAEVLRVLCDGGLWLFATLGPDTLKELRASFAAADDLPHVNVFIDLHDLGDQLQQAGFSDPVMDMETLTLTYPTVTALARDLKAIGAHNVLPQRGAGFSRGRWQRVEAHYERFRQDGVLPATYEVIYGHAWRLPRPARVAAGPQVIQMHPRH
jgi:malonyl-CoA O-methyltransferase